jgi:hypothetical protein
MKYKLIDLFLSIVTNMYYMYIGNIRVVSVVIAFSKYVKKNKIKQFTGYKTYQVNHKLTFSTNIGLIPVVDFYFSMS